MFYTILFLILCASPVIFMFGIILNGILFHTKIGRKFVHFLGYRSKATLGQFLIYKNDKSVKIKTDKIFSKMILDYLNYHRYENMKNIEDFIPIFIKAYRESYLEEIVGQRNKMSKRYLQQSLISLREVRKKSFELINARLVELLDTQPL